VHFAGVFVRVATARDEWAHRLSSATRLTADSSTLSSRQLGSITIVADTRLALISDASAGLRVSTGSLLPAPGESLIESLVDHAGLGSCLMRCRGNFAGAVVAADGSRLTLYTDILGTHPIYFAGMQDAFVFSTSQRVIVEMLRGRLSTDTEGLLETCTFGFPLADRTVYREIRCMDAAQIVTADRAGTETDSYWDWRRLDMPVASDVHQLADRAYSTFRDAIHRRQQPESTAYTLLSGGMDSRSIVATQAALGMTTGTLTVGHRQALDVALARQTAECLNLDWRLHEFQHSAFRAGGSLRSGDRQPREHARQVALRQLDQRRLALHGGERHPLGLDHRRVIAAASLRHGSPPVRAISSLASGKEATYPVVSITGASSDDGIGDYLGPVVERQLRGERGDNSCAEDRVPALSSARHAQPYADHSSRSPNAPSTGRRAPFSRDPLTCCAKR